MKYVGIQTQQRRNNLRSVVLLFFFPCLVIMLTFLFSFIFLFWESMEGERYGLLSNSFNMTKSLIPIILTGVIIWFIVAYFSNIRIINKATSAKPLERRENKRVYNLVENLCMTQGMRMPNIQVIEDYSLNAYASGINKKTYTITLSRGIIENLEDEELEAVIAHELSHIKNRDVRLLIVSIVFVGVFSMIAEMAIKMVRYSSFSGGKNNKSNGIILLIAFAVAILGYLFASLMRFAISRNREYIADAGAAEMTRNPLALAGALRKISNNPAIEAVKRNDIAQLFIEHPLEKKKSLFNGLSSLFATHPPIDKRIEVLEGF